MALLRLGFKVRFGSEADVARVRQHVCLVPKANLLNLEHAD